MKARIIFRGDSPFLALLDDNLSSASMKTRFHGELLEVRLRSHNQIFPDGAFCSRFLRTAEPALGSAQPAEKQLFIL